VIQHQAAPVAERKGTTTLMLIAVFKLVKGLLLIAAGVGAFKLINRNVEDAVEHWVTVLRVDPDNVLIHNLITRVLAVSPNQLKALGVGTFVYAGLLLTEGTGLLLRKGWAEYFTIVTTAGLIPLEIYEIAKHVSATKLAVLAVNIAIVVYLVVRVRRYRKTPADRSPRI
jgi:uncharacterized membrane protein (DUF2068 family)